MSESDRCATTSCGYICIRRVGHGALHLDPHGEWWILNPHGPDEPECKPMSGYRILNDDLLTSAATLYGRTEPIDYELK